MHITTSKAVIEQHASLCNDWGGSSSTSFGQYAELMFDVHDDSEINELPPVNWRATQDIAVVNAVDVVPEKLDPEECITR